jgi:hypothetical protein
MKDDPSHYNSYVNEEGMIFLMFLPTSKFNAPGIVTKKVKTDDKTIDRAIFEYPEAFYWSYDSASKSIGKLIMATYYQGEEQESLSTIATWSPDNAIAVAQTRENMRRVLENWNLNGGQIAEDWIHGKEGWEDIGFLPPEDYEGDISDLIPDIQENGFFGLLALAWSSKQRGFHSIERDTNTFQVIVHPIMKLLFDGSATIGRSGPVESGRWSKVTVAVKPMRINKSDASWDPGMEFGPYYAEGWDGNNQKIDVDTILSAFDVGPEVLDKMSEYISQFVFRKVWTDQNPGPIYTFMQNAENQTPENIQKADEFFIDRPFEENTWRWAKDRAEIDAPEGKGLRYEIEPSKDYMYGAPHEVEPIPWAELEAVFLEELDTATRERKQIRDWKDKLLTWKGNRELQADIDKEHADKKLDIPSWNNQGLGQGPPEVSQWVNGKYHAWIESRENVIHSFLGGHRGSGLKYYLMFTRKWSWPELESRLLKKEYAWSGLEQLGAEWTRLGRKSRWKEYEELLKELWIDTLAPGGRKPNQSYYDRMSMSDAEKIERYGTVPAADEAGQDSMVERLRWKGNIESVLTLIRDLKNAYLSLGGHDWTDHSKGNNQDEKVTDFAPGAWWDDDEIIGLYWMGNIVKQHTPSQKRRGKHPTKWKVIGDVPTRPFFSGSAFPIGQYLDKMPNPTELERSK